MNNLQKRNKPYVKADLTSELNTALETVYKKLGIARSSIVNTALSYYFKNQYPEDLPKTDAEIYEKARQTYLHNEISRRYTKIQISTRYTENYEKEMSRFEDEIKKFEQRILMKQKSLETTKSDKKRLEIQTEINNLQHSIENNKSLIYMNKRAINNARTGEESY